MKRAARPGFARHANSNWHPLDPDAVPMRFSALPERMHEAAPQVARRRPDLLNAHADLVDARGRLSHRSRCVKGLLRAIGAPVDAIGANAAPTHEEARGLYLDALELIHASRDCSLLFDGQRTMRA